MNIEDEMENAVAQSNLPVVLNYKIKEQLEYMNKVAEEAVWK